MASEGKIKELFELSKSAKFFSGLKEEDVWKACQDYSDRSDGEIDQAMQRIKEKDVEIKMVEEQKQKAVVEQKDKDEELKKMEVEERVSEEKTAEKLLDQLMQIK